MRNFLLSPPFLRRITTTFFVCLLTAPVCFAQTQPQSSAPDASPIRTTPHKSSKQKPAASQPAPPPAPPAPDWPINDHPSPASIAWKSSELRIDAANSSLQQILLDVSSQTGAEVEGLGKDERVFGAFGPGPTRDVLSQLLQGSGYNVVMVGDEGQGVPRQIILSERDTSKAPQPAARPAPEPEDDTPDYPPYEPQAQPQQAPQPPTRPGFPPDQQGPLRNPQQMQQQPGQLPQNQQPQPSQPQQQNQPNE
jgi:hypothetical protein